MTKQLNIEFSDIEQFLEENRQIAIIWSTEDVKEIRPDLTDDQAWDVLKRCEKCHNCEAGFTWTFIEDIAEDIFPVPGDDTDEEEDDVS